MAINLVELQKSISNGDLQTQQKVAAAMNPTLEVAVSAKQANNVFKSSNQTDVNMISTGLDFGIDLANKQDALKQDLSKVEQLSLLATAEEERIYQEKTARIAAVEDRAKQTVGAQLSRLQELQEQPTDGIFAPFKYIAKQVKMEALREDIRQSVKIANDAQALQTSYTNDKRVNLERIRSTTLAQEEFAAREKYRLSTIGANQLALAIQATREVAEKNATTASKMLAVGLQKSGNDINIEQNARQARAEKEQQLANNSSEIAMAAWVLGGDPKLTFAQVRADKQRMAEGLRFMSGMSAEDRAQMLVHAKDIERAIDSGHVTDYASAQKYLIDRSNISQASSYNKLFGDYPGYRLTEASLNGYATAKGKARYEEWVKKDGLMASDGEKKNMQRQLITEEANKAMLMNTYELVQENMNNLKENAPGVSKDGSDINSRTFETSLNKLIPADDPRRPALESILRNPVKVGKLDMPVMDSNKAVFHKIDTMRQLLEEAGIKTEREQFQFISDIYKDSVRSRFAANDAFAAGLRDNGKMNEIPVSLKVSKKTVAASGAGLAGFLNSGGATPYSKTVSAQRDFLSGGDSIDLSDPAAAWRYWNAGKREQALPHPTEGLSPF